MVTFTRRRALELALRIEEMATHTPTDDDSRPVAVAIMMAHSGLAIPVVSLAMDNAMLASVKRAEGLSATALAYDCNTVELAGYSVAEAANARAACPYFMAQDGGVRVYDGLDELVCTVGVDGRSPRASRILAVMAADALGYKTDFGADGLTDKERAIPKRLPGDL